MKYIVRLEHIVKRFEDVVAVDDISLDIEKGEFITLLGPSGSGKTTTLMLIAGFETPTCGNIFIEDQLMTYKPPFKRNIGMVFQNYALFPHMTVFENVAFPLRERRVQRKEISKRVEDILDLVELRGFGNRYPKQLSGGQQQRVALARALVYNPPVLLMDEPLGALDKKLRENMQLEITNLQKSLRLTVIYVTHDQTEALTMSDRIAVINLGKIEQLDCPKELYERPANQFVADFIGETNLINLKTVTQKDDRIELITVKDMRIFVSNRFWCDDNSLSVAIRPEKISFRECSNEGCYTYNGIIKDVIYLGDEMKYKVLVENRELLIVTQKSGAASKAYSAGDRVLLFWRDEDMNFFESRGKGKGVRAV
jgi:putative spermidine/putrescine transport system ATP-binding protein